MVKKEVFEYALISDADILIGATALVNDFGVVTNNISHFEYIKDLILENWMSEKIN